MASGAFDAWSGGPMTVAVGIAIGVTLLVAVLAVRQGRRDSAHRVAVRRERPGFERPTPSRPGRAVRRMREGGSRTSWRFVGVLAVLIAAVTLISDHRARDRLLDWAPVMDEWAEALGIPRPAPGRGLTLETGVPTRTVVNGTDTLVVGGTIVNAGDRSRPVPDLRLVLSNDAGDTVREVVRPALMETVAPGQRIPFRISVGIPGDIPRPDATTVAVTFVRRGTAQGPPETGPPAGDGPGARTGKPTRP
nr:DUF3426 domain-containing protein [Roseospira visakhapatnamensis]